MTQHFPPELLYADSHEYVRRNADGSITVGISAFAVEELGDIVFVELPEEGARLEQGDSFGTVESVKAVEELVAPMAGTVLRRNEAVLASPEDLQNDPYGDGWLLRLEPGPDAATDGLRSSADYAAQVRQG